MIAYYSGDGKDLDKYRFDQLTQVIYSFCHLKGNKLAVDNSDDSLAIRNLVALKKQFPTLKVLLSLGGWCGCEHCSTVFSSAGGRAEFSESVLALMKTYQTDGLDLDWEYPAISGCPD
ncbi:MAG: glycoside hydrolase, partial [Saprospiraceae bacterium]|nr:glycoside hydrolase [Saprospiraceae bacterium]